MTLKEWQQTVHARNQEKGFYDYEHDWNIVADFVSDVDGCPAAIREPLCRMLADYRQAMIERKLLLVIGELCEAHEELRSGHRLREVYFKTTDPGVGVNAKPEGFPIELADAQIRLLDLEEACGIDAEEMMAAKHAYNETRPFKHGRKF